MDGATGRTEAWMRADAMAAVRLLSTLRGAEAAVAGWMLASMDTRTNRVAGTQADIAAADGFFSRHARGGAPAPSTVTRALRVLGGKPDGERRLRLPFVVMERPGLYMVNPAYAFVGRQRAGAELSRSFERLRSAAGVGAAYKFRVGKGGWLKAGRMQLAAMLATLRGAEAQVAAYLLASTDTRTNTIRATQAMAAAGEVDRAGLAARLGTLPTPGTTVTKAAMRLLEGGEAGDGRRLDTPFCVMVGYGQYMLNPACFFVGGDDKGAELRRRFRRLDIDRNGGRGPRAT